MTQKKGEMIMLKKLVTATIVLSLFLVCSLHVSAAICPDVRDYNEHRYNYRHYIGGTTRYLVNTVENVNQPYQDKNGIYHDQYGTLYVYRVYRYETFICVCGLGYSDRIHQYDDWVFVPF